MDLRWLEKLAGIFTRNGRKGASDTTTTHSVPHIAAKDRDDTSSEAPFLLFPCSGCSHEIVLTAVLGPGDLTLMECPQCKLRYAAYLPSIRVELITPDADPMSAERILHDLTGTRLSAYGEPLGEEGPNVVRSE